MVLVPGTGTQHEQEYDIIIIGCNFSWSRSSTSSLYIYWSIHNKMLKYIPRVVVAGAPRGRQDDVAALYMKSIYYNINDEQSLPHANVHLSSSQMLCPAH